MLLESIQAKLNEQIGKEFFASNQYLAMASWCENKGFDGSAAFLYKSSEEERGHMLQFFKYINNAGGHAKIMASQSPEEHFGSLVEIFEKVLALEKSVSESIHQLADFCLTNKDFATFFFLKDFIQEQQAAEKTSQDILDLFKIAGSDGRGLFMVDKAIKKRFVPLAE